jgi:hypothetical protein
MNIHIERPTAGIINVSEGPMTFYGNQQANVVTDESARQAVSELRSALAREALDRPTAARTRNQIAEIEAAMRAPQPNKSRIAEIVERLTRLLVTAGSLTTASTAIVSPLQTLAAWLGHLGVSILGMLPG